MRAAGPPDRTFERWLLASVVVFDTRAPERVNLNLGVFRWGLLP